MHKCFLNMNICTKSKRDKLFSLFLKESIGTQTFVSLDFEWIIYVCHLMRTVLEKLLEQ